MYCRTLDLVLSLSVSGIVSLNSSSSVLQLLHCLPVPCNFPSITCIRGQLVCKKWPFQLAFLHFILSIRFLYSSTLCNTSLLFTLSIHFFSYSCTQILPDMYATYLWSMSEVTFKVYVFSTLALSIKHFRFVSFVSLILGMVLCVWWGVSQVH